MLYSTASGPSGAITSPAQPAPEPEPERITVAAALDRYSEYIKYHRPLHTVYRKGMRNSDMHVRINEGSLAAFA